MNTSSAIDVVLLIRQAKVIALEPSIKSYKAVAKQTQAKKPTNHEDEKIALILSLVGGFTRWNIFYEKKKAKPMSGCSISRFATWDFNLAS